MAKIHPGATLVPHFRDFLPVWVARQPWYRGTGRPSLSPVGFFRLEDPDGEVGMETHLVRDGDTVYQIPMTYRGSPLAQHAVGASDPLIATAEHSVLGTRWIYDGPGDPGWVAEVLRLVGNGGVTEPGGRRGVGPAGARGHLLVSRAPAFDAVVIDLLRVLTPGRPGVLPDAVGLMTGTWYPDGPDAPAVEGCLAVIREKRG
ncbi:maltokinase N-terminal cap-like domain-containing protein [Planosporangium sp. 12N6]|uniref:maltokinase N-terminal cap-like domain-containing protein n=1 Tax=Planosporangium spinosum TaxID=3402278 RepID=UPI003CECACC3